MSDENITMSVPDKQGESNTEMEQSTSYVPQRAPPWVLGVAAAVLLFTGSFDSIIGKLMNKQKLPPCNGCEPQYFEAPFFQTATMYIGEALCLLVFYTDAWTAKCQGRRPRLDIPSSAKSFNKPPCPKYWWLIPTIIDFAASSMINYAFVFSQPSTVQLLRNFNVIVTAVLTTLYLHVGLRIHQLLGVAVISVGLIVTGLWAMLNPDEGNNYGDYAWVGIVMAIGGTVLSSFQFVFEESLFRKYTVSPLEAVGLMGVYGVIIGSIVLLVLQYIPGEAFEKTSITFYMMSAGNSEATILILSNVGFILSVSAFNASGLTVTKLGSGLLRTVLIAGRTLTVWIMEQILRWSPFSVLQMMGLFIVLGGVLLYNYNYISADNCCFMDGYLKRALLCCGGKDPNAVDDESADRNTIEQSKSIEDNDLMCPVQETVR